jgi:hypothetical protein
MAKTSGPSSSARHPRQHEPTTGELMMLSGLIVGRAGPVARTWDDLLQCRFLAAANRLNTF